MERQSKKNKYARARNEFDSFAEGSTIFRDICGSFNCTLCFLLIGMILVLGYTALLLERGFDKPDPSQQA